MHFDVLSTLWKQTMPHYITENNKHLSLPFAMIKKIGDLHEKCEETNTVP